MVRARRFGAVALLLPVVAAGQFLLPSYPVAKALAYDAWQLGTRLESRGDRAGALAEYREAIRLWPDSGEAWHGAGVALVELNRLPEAADAYREALIRLPGSAPTHYNLGAVRGRMGDDAGALAEFREAVRIDPLDPRYRADLGVALARTGRTDEALREFREALRIRPGFAPALRGLDALGARP